MQICIVVDRGLVQFIDQQFINEVQQKQRNGADDPQYGYNAREHHGNNKQSDQESIPLFDRVDIIAEQIDVLLLCSAAGLSEAYFFVPTPPETFDEIGKGQFDEGEGHVEEHGQNDYTANVDIPIC